MHGSEKGQQVGTKAFRCGYKGCGRQYTTAHHLKVKQLMCSQCANQTDPRILMPDQNVPLQRSRETLLGEGQMLQEMSGYPLVASLCSEFFSEVFGEVLSTLKEQEEASVSSEKSSGNTSVGRGFDP